MGQYYFEMTDTFGGELNYCWIHRFKIEAKSPRGAIQKLSRETGFKFRFDGLVYRAKGAHVAAYAFDYDLAPNQLQDWLDKAVVL